jgi:RNA polymerase sigma factor (sigma-70 family)
MAVALGSNATRAETSSSDAGRLFEAHSRRLLAFCGSQLPTRAEAEDAVQTTFLCAHRALERGVVPENEYAWLHAIAKNVCRWQLRTLARRGSLSSDVDLDAFPSRLADVTYARELREELDDALAAIPESQRQAFVLREVHGLTAREVASRLGMSAPATYALLTRARRSLAEAVTASRRGPLLGVDLGSLLFKLKALVAGSTAKVVATTVAVGSVAIGGVALERAVDGPAPARPSPPSADAVGTGVPGDDPRAAPSSVAALALDRSRSTPIRGRTRPSSTSVPASTAAPAGPATTPAAEPPALEPGDSTPEASASPSVEPQPAGSGDPLPVEPDLPAPEEVPPTIEELVDPLLEDLPELPLPDLEDPTLPTDELVPPPLDDVVDDTLSDVEDTVSDLPLPEIDLPLLP